VTESRCCGCGVVLPDAGGPTHPYMLSSPACWAAYGEVSSRAYLDPQRLEVTGPNAVLVQPMRGEAARDSAGQRDGVRVATVGSLQQPQREPQVAHAARHRADVPPTPQTIREVTRVRHPAVRGLDRGDTGVVRGPADRDRNVAAQPEWGQTCCDGGRLTATGPTRRALGVVGVQGPAGHPVVGLGPVRHLRQVGLAKHNAAGIPKARHRGGVGAWHVVDEQQRPAGRARSGGVEGILYCERDAGERAAARPAGSLQGLLREHRDEGVDALADRLDTIQVGLYNLDGRDLAPGYQPRQLRGIQPDQIRDVHLHDANPDPSWPKAARDGGPGKQEVACLAISSSLTWFPSCPGRSREPARPMHTTNTTGRRFARHAASSAAMLPRTPGCGPSPVAGVAEPRCTTTTTAIRSMPGSGSSMRAVSGMRGPPLLRPVGGVQSVVLRAGEIRTGDHPGRLGAVGR